MLCGVRAVSSIASWKPPYCNLHMARSSFVRFQKPAVDAMKVRLVAMTVAVLSALGEQPSYYACPVIWVIHTLQMQQHKRDSATHSLPYTVAIAILYN